MTWLSWLSHLHYVWNKERKRIDKQEVYIVFCLVIFLLNQSKNNAVRESRAGHFRGLVGFEAKDLSFEGKAKDFKICPGGLHLY